MVSGVRANYWPHGNMVHTGMHTIHLIVIVAFIMVIFMSMMYSVFFLWGSSIGDICVLLVAFLGFLGAESFSPKSRVLACS